MSDFSGSPPSSAIAFGVLSILLGANGVSFSATLASDSQLNFPEIPVHVSIISIVIYLAVLLAISAASTVLDKIRMLKKKVEAFLIYRNIRFRETLRFMSHT